MYTNYHEKKTNCYGVAITMRELYEKHVWMQ